MLWKTQQTPVLNRLSYRKAGFVASESNSTGLVFTSTLRKIILLSDRSCRIYYILNPYQALSFFDIIVRTWISCGLVSFQIWQFCLSAYHLAQKWAYRWKWFFFKDLGQLPTVPEPNPPSRVVVYDRLYSVPRLLEFCMDGSSHESQCIQLKRGVLATALDSSPHVHEEPVLINRLLKQWLEFIHHHYKWNT